MINSKKYLQFWKKYGPCALVTGGLSEGFSALSAAFAEALARRGLNLVLIDRDREYLEDTASRIRERYSVDILTLTADLADYNEVKNIITDFSASIGLLVAPPLPAKILSKTMVQNKRGGIALMFSSANKAASSLAKDLRKDLKPHGITVIECRAGNAQNRQAEKTLEKLGKEPFNISEVINKLRHFILMRL